MDGHVHLVQACHKRRALFLLFALLLWASVILIRLSQFMVFQRTHYLDAGVEKSWRAGEIPPYRGRILDRQGEPLAWSSRSFALEYAVPSSVDLCRSDLEQALHAKLVPPTLSALHLAPLAGEHFMLAESLSPRETAAALALHRKNPRFHVRHRFIRQYHPDPAVRRLLGSVQTVDGVETGVTGLEKRHDELLRGCPGRYRVMVDRHGRWIMETWEKVMELRPGYDVYVPLQVGGRPEVP